MDVVLKSISQQKKEKNIPNHLPTSSRTFLSKTLDMPLAQYNPRASKNKYHFP